MARASGFTTYHPTDAELERERRALEMRRKPVPFSQIAKELGYGDARKAQLAVKRALARPVQHAAKELREIEGDRLDALQAAIWDEAMDGNLAAVNEVLKIMARRAQLYGLDYSDKIAEQRIRLESEKVKLVAVALGRALDTIGLTNDQREQVKLVMLREMRAEDEVLAIGSELL